MLSKLKKYRFFIFGVFFAFLLGGCTTVYNPATKKNETLLINTAQEVKLGKQMDEEVQRELKISHDPKMQIRLNYVGEKIARASDRQDLLYHFRIVEDKELNAFSIPGGYVYINSALMNAATDDELACVVAHEIGHIAAKHSVKRLQAALGYQIILNIALGASESANLASAMDIVFNLGALGYGRQDEFLADELAVKYAKKANFNPYGMVTFFQKLKKEAERKGSGTQIVFLSSHPPIDERIKNVEKEILNNP